VEFSYRISEEEYLNAEKPNSKSGAVIKTILFWLIVLAFLMLVITAFQHFLHPAPIAQHPTTPHAGSHFSVAEFFGDSWPLDVILVVWVLISALSPKFQRRRYRKDPAMKGQFTVSLTLESISVHNSVGTFSQSGWDSYFTWYEAKGVIVLFSRSATRLLIGLAGLSDAQQNELRGILTSAIPRKLGARRASSKP
jgi:hypothetical protein